MIFAKRWVWWSVFIAAYLFMRHVAEALHVQ
jgi:hypothetical protein